MNAHVALCLNTANTLRQWRAPKTRHHGDPGRALQWRPSVARIDPLGGFHLNVA
jgi:hypothetical protein